MYGLLLKTAAQTLLTIGADTKQLVFFGKCLALQEDKAFLIVFKYEQG